MGILWWFSEMYSVGHQGQISPEANGTSGAPLRGAPAVGSSGHCFCQIRWQQSVKTAVSGFTGGPVVKNLPANAEDMDLIPDLRRLHTPQGN